MQANVGVRLIVNNHKIHIKICITKLKLKFEEMSVNNEELHTQHVGCTTGGPLEKQETVRSDINFTPAVRNQH